MHAPTTDQLAVADELTQSPDIDFIYGHHAHVVQPYDKVNGSGSSTGSATRSRSRDTAVEGVYDGNTCRVTFTERPRRLVQGGQARVHPDHDHPLRRQQPDALAERAAVARRPRATPACMPACRPPSSVSPTSSAASAPSSRASPKASDRPSRVAELALEPPDVHRRLARRPRGRGRVGCGGPISSGSRVTSTVRRSRGVADVDAVPAHPARGPGRRRGAEPPAAGPRRLRPPRRPRHLLVAAARLPGAAQRRADRARGDGRDRRPGGALPGAAAARALRGQPTAGPSTATTSSGSRTARAPTTCSARPTRRCSPCW